MPEFVRAPLVKSEIQLRKFIFCIATVLLSFPASGQNISYEAYKLGEQFSAANWKSMEQSLPILITGLESQLRTGGATDRASKALAEQLRINMTQESFARLYAHVLSEKMSVEELKALHEFMQSAIGKKYLNLNNEMAGDLSYLRPLLRRSCEAANQQLSTFDRGSINSVCSQF